jgi:glycosyltransferase involved in cell wall biosynthesis
VFNEETTLAVRLEGVLELLPELTSRFEILVIDNGSTDLTSDLADELAREYPQLKVFRLSRHQSAEAVLQTAFDRARGDILLLLQPGQAASPAQIRRSWQAAVAELTPTTAGPPSASLAERLSRWGRAVATEQGVAASGEPSVQILRRGEPISVRVSTANVQPSLAAVSVPRPASFLEHLRGLALGK